MSNSKTLWYILLVAWIAGSVYWHVCKIKALCDTGLTEVEPSRQTLKIEPLQITDGNDLILKSQGNFSFAKNQNIPALTAVQPELDSVVNYLKSNTNKKLLISGQSGSGETPSAQHADLGMARAQVLKDWFIQKGIPDSVIILSSSQNNDLVFVNDSLMGGLSLRFNNVPTTTKALTETELANEQKFESIFKPIDLYFPTASSQYIKTDQNQKFFVAAKKFLEENKDKKLILTGHTDDEDSAEWNLTLSKRRASVVKKQFVLAGIPSDRIITRGKGEWEPKASNATLQGKRANRRVNMVVQ